MATDDTAPIPVMPELPIIAEQEAEANQNDLQVAQAYWHPAWAKVQEMFEEKIASFGSNGAISYQDKTAEEFKVHMLVDAHVTDALTEIMEDVKRAVESVESVERKRSPRRK